MESTLAGLNDVCEPLKASPVHFCSTAKLPFSVPRPVTERPIRIQVNRWAFLAISIILDLAPVEIGRIAPEAGWSRDRPSSRGGACLVPELAPSGGSRRSPSGAALARGARPPAVPAPSAAREALHRVLPSRDGERRDPDGALGHWRRNAIFNRPRRSLGLPSESASGPAELR